MRGNVCGIAALSSIGLKGHEIIAQGWAPAMPWVRNVRIPRGLKGRQKRHPPAPRPPRPEQEMSHTALHQPSRI